MWAGEGIADVTKAVRIERRGRDVYIMGAANVGKSAFVRCAHVASQGLLMGDFKAFEGVP